MSTVASHHPVDAHSGGASAATPVAPSSGRLRPLGLDEVEILSGFWADRQRTNHDAVLAHIEYWLEREGWLANFDLAATRGLPERRRGREFSDSEVYKYLEALAWEIGRTDDPALEERFRRIVGRVAAAQEDDGYLNTRFGRPGQGARWTDLEWGHELYCLGHLFQAAVARGRTRPGADDGLVEVARRAADLVVAEFGEGARETVCGHAEIEPALVELGRLLHDDRYIEQARLFVERRGRQVLKDIEWGRSYFQDDVPVRESTVLHGHAVRANYLAAGATDVAIERGDRDLLSTLSTQWENTRERRTYLTGGQGSHHQDEAFGEDWVLPSDRSYSETCAGIGSIMFSWRLLLAEGDARYGDLIERTLYNVVATSPSDTGTAFFYTNTLHKREPGEESAPDTLSPRAASSLRAPWFEVSCCPPNVARTFATLGTLLATVDDDGVQLHQYADSRIRTTLGDGSEVVLRVETEYPAEGRIAIRVEATRPEAWTLSLRIPAWTTGASVTVPGGTAADRREVGPGTAEVRRVFAAGDLIVLDLPVEPRLVQPDPRIDAIRGTVAVERGPEVLCVELPGGNAEDLNAVRALDGATPTESHGRVHLKGLLAPLPAIDWPYTSGRPAFNGGDAELTLTPYHSWGNRGASVMRVWIPVGR